MVLIILFCEMFWSFTFTFIFCEIGEQISHAFYEIDYVTEQFGWYVLPTKIWKNLTIILLYGEKPVGFRCFGTVSCNRELFKNVSRNNH